MKRHALGLHTMRDEHFGISVVEFMAAGAVVAGPSSAVQQHQEQSELSRSLLTTPLALLWTLLGPEWYLSTSWYFYGTSWHHGDWHEPEPLCR